MEILITIAKFLGLTLSTVLGVVAIVGKSHEEIQVRRLIQVPGLPETQIVRRLTPWGKGSLAGILTGGIIALTALVFDAVHQKQKNRQTINRIEDQVLLAQRTLDQIQHVVMRFESLEIATRFEIPASAFQLSGLISESEKSNFIRTMSSTNKVFMFVQAVTTSPMESSNATNPLTAENCEVIAIANQSDGTVTSANGEITSLGFNLIHPITLKSLEESKLPKGSTKDGRNKMLSFLRSPQTTLSIWRADSGRASQDGDFSASSKFPRILTLEYLFPSDQIRISWRTEYPKSTWVHNAKMNSMPDLSGAFVRLRLDNYPKKEASLLPRTSSPSATNAGSLKIAFNAIPIIANCQQPQPDNLNGTTGVLPKKEDFIPTDLSDFRNNPTLAAKLDYRINANQTVKGLRLRTESSSNDPIADAGVEKAKETILEIETARDP